MCTVYVVYICTYIRFSNYLSVLAATDTTESCSGSFFNTSACTIHSSQYIQSVGLAIRSVERASSSYTYIHIYMSNEQPALRCLTLEVNMSTGCLKERI